MKHLLVALVLLFGAGFAWASETSDYSHCVPYCVTFEQIGEKYFAVLRSAAGKQVGLTEVDRDIGVLLTATYPFPLSVSDFSGTNEIGVASTVLPSYGQPQASTGNCSAEVTTFSDETETEFVLHPYVRIYCDSKLVDSSVYTRRIPKPSADDPA